MIKSCRRIALAMLLVVITTLGFVSVQSATSLCHKGFACVAAAVYGTLDITTAGSTSSVVTTSSVDWSLAIEVARLTSLYGLLSAILLLLVLESTHPHYLRHFVRSTRPRYR